MAKNDPVSRIRAKALLELEKANRRLIPEDVVEAARDERHVLHGYFEWDDTVAGNLYRIEQARTLIREVKVQTVYEDRVIVVPQYVSDPDPDRKRNGYVHVDVVKQRADDARRTVLDELSRVEGALTRARAVSAVLGLRDDLDRMVEALMEARGKLAA